MLCLATLVIVVMVGLMTAFNVVVTRAFKDAYMEESSASVRARARRPIGHSPRRPLPPLPLKVVCPLPSPWCDPPPSNPLLAGRRGDAH
tara:strand:- start:520 stop:786 length:267 start_codon:yes stop_codon:yes gene_type:complete